MKKVYLIAVIVALIAGFATYMFATQIEQKTTIKDADTVQVIVAIQDIPANTKLTPEMFAEDTAQFQVKTVIEADASPNAIKLEEGEDFTAAAERLAGMITVDTIYANEQINENRIVGSDSQDIALSLKLPEGMVALSMTAQDVQGVDGYLTEGDIVDILISKQDSSTGEFKTEVAYDDLKILRVTNNSANTTATTAGKVITEYSTVTVAVTPEQALELRDIEMNNSDYKFILNPRTPDQLATAEAAE